MLKLESALDQRETAVPEWWLTAISTIAGTVAGARILAPSDPRPNCRSTFDAVLPKVVQATYLDAPAALGYYLGSAHLSPTAQDRYYTMGVAYGVASMQGSGLLALR
jgi:hypothetical protein